VRVFDRVAERDRRAKGLWGRLLGLVFVAALDAVAVLPGALGFTGRFNLVSGVAARPRSRSVDVAAALR
jgi:hypothetical protein